MVTKDICSAAVMEELLKVNLVEMSSGNGQKFCDAIGAAMYKVLTELNVGYMTHTHECTAPGTPSLTPTVPLVG